MNWNSLISTPGILNERRIILPSNFARRPAATFFVRVKGDGMTTGIHSGDLLMIDRSLKPRNKSLVVLLDGEHKLKRVVKK